MKKDKSSTGYIPKIICKLDIKRLELFYLYLGKFKCVCSSVG